MLSEQRRGRLVAAVALIVLGGLTLINNLFNFNLTEWFWIVALGGAALAFGWVYIQEREEWAIIVAYVTGAIAVLIFMVTQLTVSGNLVPVYVLLAIAVPFVYAWLRDRQQWGLLVPAYVMVVIIPVLFMGDSNSDLVAPYVMLVIGAPFILAYVFTRQWPFLIPGGIMLLIGAFLLFGATGAVSQAISVIIALGFILAGVWMLWQRGGEPLKRKNE